MSGYREAKERLEDHKAWALKEYSEVLEAYAELEGHWKRAFEVAHEARMSAVCPICGDAWRDHRRPRMPEVVADILSYGEYVEWLGRKEEKEQRELEARRQQSVKDGYNVKIRRAVSDYEAKKTKRIEI